jgi:uncharacterized surface protein with fasciclin (FAS1) repeats
MTTHRRARRTAGLAGAVAIALAGCSSNVAETHPASATHQPGNGAGSTRTSAAPAPTPSATTTSGRPAPAGLVGDGCADYSDKVPAGAGSLDGMSRDPVAVAISNSPLLTTLAGALAGRLNPDVDLTQKLNGGQFTVFAPTDDAFGKLAPETVDKLRTDSQLLKSVLTYHLVPDRIDPKSIAGEHKTVQGQSLNVTGGGDGLRVNDAGVVCGGIKTANATVYLIDTVLTPPPPAPATSTTSTSGADSGEQTSTTPTS